MRFTEILEWGICALTVKTIFELYSFFQNFQPNIVNLLARMHDEVKAADVSRQFIKHVLKCACMHLGKGLADIGDSANLTVKLLSGLDRALPLVVGELEVLQLPSCFE